MTLGVDIHLLVQTVLYFGAVIAGLVTAVPVGVTSINFGGHCILYGSCSWKNETTFTYEFGSTSLCNFIVAFNVIACILFAFGSGCYYAYAVHRCKADPTIASQMWVMPYILITSMIAASCFVSSCVLSVGFSMWCNSFMSGRDHGATYLKSCSDGQKSGKIDWNRPLTGSKRTDYNASTYYNFMTTAQTASWIGFLIWAVQFALCIARLVRNRRRRSAETYQADGDVTTSDTKEIAKEEPTA